MHYVMHCVMHYAKHYVKHYAKHYVMHYAKHCAKHYVMRYVMHYVMQVQRELDGLKQSKDDAIAKAARAANRVLAQGNAAWPTRAPPTVATCGSTCGSTFGSTVARGALARARCPVVVCAPVQSLDR